MAMKLNPGTRAACSVGCEVSTPVSITATVIPVPVKPEGVVRFAIEGIELLPGGFDVDIGITDPQDRAYDYHQKGVQFRVIETSREVGVARLAHRWEFR